MSSPELKGKVVIVTGASSGIGEATARRLAQEGCALVLVARRGKRLEVLSEDLRTAYGVEVQAVPGDVARPETAAAVMERAMAEFGRVDALVNNAGIGRLGWLERLHPETDIRYQVEVNLLGAIWMARAVLPVMQAQRAGHVINVASVAGLIATPTYSVYAATKFGLRGFSEALRREARPWGVRVSTLLPGPVETGFAAESVRARRSRRTTPRRLRLTATQVAGAVVSLLRRPRATLILPHWLTLAVWLNAAMPWLVDAALVRLFVVPERGQEL